MIGFTGKGSATWVALIACSAGLLEAACGRAEPQVHQERTTSPTGAAQPPQATEELPGSGSLILSPSQLASIKIEVAETYGFRVTKEAVGSIGFVEDPAIIQAESALLGAAATADLTTKELARAAALSASNGGVSQREVEQATSDHQTAEAALKAAREALRALGKTQAEIDQMIASHKVDTDAVADSASRQSRKWALVNVVESDVPLFRVGQVVRVTVMALPDRQFSGRVARIYGVVDPDTHRGKLRAEIADPANQLRPGMLSNFVIQVGPRVEATAIPVNAAVREGDGTMTVWVTTDRRHFVPKSVKLGLQEDGRYQVLEGVRSGDLVVTDGAVFLSNMLQAPPQ